jgi:hypothetical protein
MMYEFSLFIIINFYVRCQKLQGVIFRISASNSISESIQFTRLMTDDEQEKGLLPLFGLRYGTKSTYTYEEHIILYEYIPIYMNDDDDGDHHGDSLRYNRTGHRRHHVQNEQGERLLSHA